MKKETLSLSVERREQVGSKKTAILRAKGIVPGVLYGSGLGQDKPELVQVDSLELTKLLSKIEESTLVNVVLENKIYPTLVKDIQKNPLKSEILSIDFFAPNLNEEVETPVALEFEGISQSEKIGNTLIKIHQEIEVKALPKDLPDYIVVDLTKLEAVDDVIRVSDLDLPEGVEAILDGDELIAITEIPQIEEEPELTKEELDALEKSQTDKNAKDQKDE
ncbi:50S ribosomal protein L25 [bacterium]|nr:50S ribosomal protein L25 [Candidatus Elulimicrobium humile]